MFADSLMGLTPERLAGIHRDAVASGAPSGTDHGLPGGF